MRRQAHTGACSPVIKTHRMQTLWVSSKTLRSSCPDSSLLNEVWAEQDGVPDRKRETQKKAACADSNVILIADLPKWKTGCSFQIVQISTLNHSGSTFLNTFKEAWSRVSKRETWHFIKSEIYNQYMLQTVKVKVKSLSRVRLFATPWTAAYQAPQSMGFSRQEHWSGLPFPSPRDLPDPGIEPGSPTL